MVFPQLTEERRRDLVKMARAKGEDAKVSIRNIRRQAKEELDRIAKDGEAGEDEVRRAEKELDDLTAQHVHAIDERSSTRKPSCSRSEAERGRHAHDAPFTRRPSRGRRPRNGAAAAGDRADHRARDRPAAPGG